MSPELAPVRVAIVGCGLIGSRWDAPGSALAGGPALTHAAAFSRQPGAHIVAFCDTDPALADAAAAAWGGAARAEVAAGTNLAALLDRTRPDLVVLATASAVRQAPIETALAFGVRTLVIEKPLAPTLDEGLAIHRTLARQGARALVNYARHWDPAMFALRQRIATGALGRLQRLVGLYGKGLSNNGSHMIDLAGQLCAARPVAARVLGLPAVAGGPGSSPDASVDAQLVYEDDQGVRTTLDLLATDADAFSCFELTLVGTQAICEIRLGGREITWRAVQDDPQYPGYRVPGGGEALPAQYLAAMSAMAAEALALARGQISRARCDTLTALTTAAAVATVQRAAQDPQPCWHAIEVPTA
jgi:predicted dehydrogenase